MNHLYHSLSPLVLLAAFLVSLLGFLAPDPVLSDRVSLFELSTTVTVTTGGKAKRWYAHDDSVAQAYSHRFVKRVKATNSSTSTATTVPVTVKLGPLGACYTNLTTTKLACSTPSFTPVFLDIYNDELRLPSTVSAPLPQQFPLTTTALFLSICLVAVQFLAVIGSSASMHAPKKLAVLGSHQPRLRKAATVCGGVGLVVGLAATVALRVQLGQAVQAANKLEGVVASLGTGLNLLFAGLALQAVADCLLISEAFTSR